MPIYDFICRDCSCTRLDVFTKAWDEEVKCHCGKKMEKLPSRFVADTFPSDGLFLEHVSPTGKRFHSKREMKQYAKDNDLELGALE